MSPPTSRLSRLSLDEMPPMTRSRTRAAVAGSSYEYSQHDSSSSSDWNSDRDSLADDSDSEDEDSPLIRSPAGLTYKIDHLTEKTRSAIRDSFSDPPKIALQRCRRIDHTYAFQMTELVTRSIRFRSQDQSGPTLSCSCGQDEGLCTHVLWLLDQLSGELLCNPEDNKPLHMTERGFPEDLEDPYISISEHHLGILAGSLHCQLVDPEPASHEDIDLSRVEHARELLSGVYEQAPEDFRPDIFNHPRRGKKLFKKHDLEYTIFRMLLDNTHFFNYFLSHSPPSGPAKDPFRRISKKVDMVLQELDSYASHKTPEQSTSPRNEFPADVKWAAGHILRSVSHIRSAIYNRDHPLSLQEALSAARVLIHILSSVVSRNDLTHGHQTPLDRNLYLRLVGDSDRGFVLAELNLIPEAASQFLHSLENIFDAIGRHGAPMSYVEKFTQLLSRLRAPGVRIGSKRVSQGQEIGRGPKRMK